MQMVQQTRINQSYSYECPIDQSDLSEIINLYLARDSNSQNSRNLVGEDLNHRNEE